MGSRARERAIQSATTAPLMRFPAPPATLSTDADSLAGEQPLTAFLRLSADCTPVDVLALFQTSATHGVQRERTSLLRDLPECPEGNKGRPHKAPIENIHVPLDLREDIPRFENDPTPRLEQTTKSLTTTTASRRRGVGH